MAGEDPPENANDYRWEFGSTFGALPKDASEAHATFDVRAKQFLRYFGCSGPYPGAIGTLVDKPIGVADGQILKLPLPATFAQNPEVWARDALLRLAYDGDCSGETSEQRYQRIDKAMSDPTLMSMSYNAGYDPGALIPEDIWVFPDVGTDSVGDKNAGLKTYRYGDLDMGIKDLIPILYLYNKKIPLSKDHILDVLLSKFKDNMAIRDLPYVMIPLGGVVLGNSVPPDFKFKAPETENHSLMILSEQYLVAQLINDRGREHIATQPSHDLLMKYMRGILLTDFFEYNARPYERFPWYAMHNLAQFANDSDIREAAMMVLDWSTAKFAVSSSLMRRSSPWRRRWAGGNFDGELYTGSNADELRCAFFLYTGQLQTLWFPNLTVVGPNKGGPYYGIPSFCMPYREAIGTYQPPEVVLDMAINKSAPYLQTFSGGPNYYADQFPGATSQKGSRLPVLGAAEVYYNGGPFLIAAGGLPRANGLPGETSDGSINGLANLADSIGIDVDGGPPWYSKSENDLGVSIQTVLIPFDTQKDTEDARPIVDRRQLVRIQGIGREDANLCVAPGFACGKNPTIPFDPCTSDADTNCTRKSGPWEFTMLKSSPTPTYVAMRKVDAQYKFSGAGSPITQTGAGFQIGFFEAAPASNFPSYQDFMVTVMRNNPSPKLFDHIMAKVKCYRAFDPWWSVTQNACLKPRCDGIYDPMRGDDPNEYCNEETVGWQGTYTTTSGVPLKFSIPAPVQEPWVFSQMGESGVYPVASQAMQLPKRDLSLWNLADGPIQADHKGLITITSPNTGKNCKLDITDIRNPQRSASCSNAYVQPKYKGKYMGYIFHLLLNP
jgi:hypothetical protein